MPISSIGLNLTKISEGFRAQAYPDPATGGAPWTIGYGRAYGVNQGDTCTEAQAEQWLLEDVSQDARYLDTYVKVQMTQGQYDALADFLYNIGPGRAGQRDGLIFLRNGNHSSLLNYVNSNLPDLAALEFPKWANPPLPGLVIRRNREQQLFRTGSWS